MFHPRRIAFTILIILHGLLNAQSEYYASNETGMAFEEIPAFRRTDFDFNLELRRDGVRETRTVWKRDGTEYRRWEYRRGSNGRLGRIDFYEYGILSGVEEYLQDGRLAWIESHGAGGLERKTEYSYSGKRLLSAKTLDSSGILLYSDRYKYAMNGSLREVTRSFADGRTESAGLNLSNGRVLDSWYSQGKLSTVDRYSPSGQFSDREQWDGAAVLRSDSTRLKEDGKSKDRQLLSDAERGVEIERLFDSEGRISSETTRKGGRVASKTEYVYDESGKLQDKLFFSPGKKAAIHYSYDREGKKAGEEESENGEIIRRVVYQADGSYWEEFLHEGQVTVRVRWADGWKREEEILRDGNVVRRRDFK